jgi:prolyl 4-hydroxylase
MAKNFFSSLAIFVLVVSVYVYFYQNEIMNFVQNFSYDKYFNYVQNLLNRNKNITYDDERTSENLKNQQSFDFGEELDPRINLRLIKNFLSEEECDYLVSIGKDLFKPSTVVEDDYSVKQHTGRTSSSAFLTDFMEEKPLLEMKQRVLEMFKGNVKSEDIEPFQVVKYEPGEFFNSHFDWFKVGLRDKYPQRRYTIFAYLNDIEEGGETDFPNIGKKVKPRKGNASFWVNCITKEDCFEDALHGGLPPLREIKYGLNIWIKIPQL